MSTVNETTERPAIASPSAPLAESIRQYFRNDASRMTTSAARRFRVSEETVLDALQGEGSWPVVRLRDGAFRALMAALPDLGPVRVFVRSRAAVIETVGTFGGLSESGPNFNVQSDDLAMRILPDEVASVYAVEKAGPDGAPATYSFQFFDRSGDAAFKAFLWDNFPDVPPHRVETFLGIVSRLSGPDLTAAPASEARLPVPLPVAFRNPAPRQALEPPTGPRPAPEPEPAPPRVSIPMPEGVVPGTFGVGSRILGEPTGVERPRPPVTRAARARRHAVPALAGLAGLVVFYLMMVTFVTPIFWRHHENHVKLADAPRYALTQSNVPSDPLNVGFLGADWELIRALLAAGWTPADPLTFQTGLKSARDAMKSLPYPSATLADLYLFGRRQDLMFEKPLAARKEGRRALRLWKADEFGRGEDPLWIGSVALDLGTAPGEKPSERGSHRIAPDLDAERDSLIGDIAESLRATEIFHVTGAGPALSRSNDAGQTYFTDGELAVAVLAPTPRDRVPERLLSPWGIRLKDQVWDELRPVLADIAGE